MSMPITGSPLSKPQRQSIKRLNLPHVMITGASGGIGREIAIECNRLGRNLVLLGRNRERLEETSVLCTEPHAANFHARDLTQSYLDLPFLTEFYKVDCLIHCAGLHLADSASGSLEQIHSNLIATIDTMRAVYPYMVDYRTGTIVNINSVAGLNVAPSEAIYAASKAGLRGFFRTFREEARQNNVRVMEVFPAACNTPMTAHRQDQEYLISPKEMAKTICHLIFEAPETFQVEEITLTRFKFPPKD